MGSLSTVIQSRTRSVLGSRFGHEHRVFAIAQWTDLTVREIVF